MCKPVPNFFCRIKLHVGDSMLYILQVVAGYFLMLAVMSFNGWIFIAVLIGMNHLVISYPFK